MSPSPLYTRTGDDGTTGLFGGDRVGKDHPRIHACGEVDECNAALGLAASEAQRLRATNAPPDSSKPLERISAILAQLQSRLFDLGADLATPASSKHEGKIKRINADDVRESESWIDEMDGGNPPMRHFVLPGGTELAARLHLARTICRRAERAMIQLARSEPVNPQALIYVNRISDLLFAMARRANVIAGVDDVPWIPAKPE